MVFVMTNLNGCAGLISLVSIPTTEWTGDAGDKTFKVITSRLRVFCNDGDA